VIRGVAPFTAEYPGLCLNKVTSTDFRDVLETFGVEAAYRGLIEELAVLFKAYSVDGRHLTLMADAAMQHGGWRAFNFNGVVARSGSPLFQMTFASSTRFLKTAISRGVPDLLDSVSAAVMMGERPKVGTATVHIQRPGEADEVRAALEGGWSAVESKQQQQVQQQQKQQQTQPKPQQKQQKQEQQVVHERVARSPKPMGYKRDVLAML
jgi:DNA-directed RNA polymerase I subunit RPA1